MIEYLYTEGGLTAPIKVRLDGRIVGEIRPVSEGENDGWRYFPKGKKQGGEFFFTVRECQRSLESDE